MAIIRLTALFLALSMNAVLISCGTHNKAVLDNKGKPLISGDFYYILPSTGGSIGLATYRNIFPNCATSIVQHSEKNHGHPVVFIPKSDGSINESSNLLFQFYLPNFWSNFECQPVASTYWIVYNTKIDGQYLLSIGSDHGRRQHFFQILKSTGHNSYKIMYCPDGRGCKNVGVIIDSDGVHRLALTDTSFDVTFVRG
ncbi:hypothetical protein ACFE04_031172 [Oxalis oulophora]